MILLSLSVSSCADKKIKADGKKISIIYGYPVKYGNEPFTYAAIKEQADDPKIYFVQKDYQSAIKKLPYAYYRFEGYIYLKSETGTNRGDISIPAGVSAFDGLLVPVKWEMIKQ